VIAVAALTASAVTVGVLAASTTAGAQQPGQARIINGAKVVASSPDYAKRLGFIVALENNDSPNGTTDDFEGQFCGGSLVAPR
jgi:hypothetical protein